MARYEATDEGKHAGPILDAKPPFRVMDCTHCGFAHVIPIPTEKELADVYRHEFYQRDKPLYMERHEEDRAWWSLVHDERLASLEEILGPERRRMVDVGSGPGLFLADAVRRGWQALGVEPAAEAARYSQKNGLDVIEAGLDEASVEEVLNRLGPVDAVHMNHVLEHVRDPAEILALARALLAPGGALCIAVPNDYNPFQLALQKARGKEPWWVAPPHHLNYFNHATLEALVIRCGFTPRMSESSFPIDLFLLMGDDYVGNDALGRVCHARRKAFEQLLHDAHAGELKRRLYRTFAELGLGRDAILFATRDAESLADPRART